MAPNEGLQPMTETHDNRWIKHCGSWTSNVSQPRPNAEKMLAALEHCLEAMEHTYSANVGAAEVAETGSGSARAIARSPDLATRYRHLNDAASRCADQESSQSHPHQDYGGPEHVHLSASSTRRQPDTANGAPRPSKRLLEDIPLARWYLQASQEEPPYHPHQGASATQEIGKEMKSIQDSSSSPLF